MMISKLKALTAAGALALAHSVSAAPDTQPDTHESHVHGEHCDHSHDVSKDNITADDLYLEFDMPGGRIYKHPINPRLLHPETGEMTVGFVGSLSPIACPHHMLNDPLSTNPEDIRKVIEHFEVVHRLPKGKVDEAYQKASAYWKTHIGPASAKLNKTAPQP